MAINRIECKIDYQQSARALGRELNLRVHESCLGSVKKQEDLVTFFASFSVPSTEPIFTETRLRCLVHH